MKPIKYRILTNGHTFRPYRKVLFFWQALSWSGFPTRGEAQSCIDCDRRREQWFRGPWREDGK